MASGKPLFGAGAHRAGATLGLSVMSGVATAAVAGVYLPAALREAADCPHPPTGSGCAAHPFWGFGPELFLLACAVGLASGILTAIVGLVAVRIRRERTWLGFVVIALSGLGLFAYAGFGVGVVTGVLAGLWLSEPGGSRAPSPSEWSGSFPAGVPPPARGAKRPLTPRPSVTEWDGIVASGPPNPASAGRPRVTLPSADRLAQALERSRQAAPRRPGTPSGPPPTVVLPPPPVGLRGGSRIGRPTGGPNGSPASAAPPAIPVPPPPGGPSPAGATGRWQPDRGELSPWDPHGGVPPAPAASAVVASELLDRPPPPRVPAAQGPLRMPRGAPPPAPSPADPGPVVSAPPTVRAVPDSPPPPASAASPPAPEPPPARPEPARQAPPPRATSGRPVSVHASPSFMPSGGGPRGPSSRGAPTPRPAAVATPPVAAPSPPAPIPVADRPPPPGGPLPKPRSRAWRCPNCKLVNPPWHVACTRCHAPAPPAPNS